MRHDVTVAFGNDGEVQITLPGDGTLGNPEDGRRWLDAQFVANDCEPLRASGKVLTADKLLAIAMTVGKARFENDASFRLGYARAATAALARPSVRVDTATGQVQA